MTAKEQNGAAEPQMEYILVPAPILRMAIDTIEEHTTTKIGRPVVNALEQQSRRATVSPQGEEGD